MDKRGKAYRLWTAYLKYVSRINRNLYYWRVKDENAPRGYTGLKSVPTHSFTAANTYNSLIEIPIVVSKTDAAGNVTSYELTAQMGKAPQKICVPKGFR